MFFSQSFIPASENELFVYWKQYFLFQVFFLLMETITETLGKSIFKDEIYSFQRKGLLLLVDNWFSG